MHQPEKLPLWKKIMYALGQFGWALASYAPGNLLVYFYLPPETGAQPLFPSFIFQGAILGVLTIIGLAFAFGRMFDAVTDPLVAGLSDRSKSRLGKRKSFMTYAVAPFALLSALIFLPLTPMESSLNAVWVFATVIVYYWFMTMYVTPYFSWVSELGRNPRERLFLSTLISITWALGTMVGTQVYGIQSALETLGIPSVQAFQYTVGGFALIGFIFMLFPVIFINEKKYGHPEIVDEPIMESLKSCFKNRDFLKFTLSDLAYFVALTVAWTGLVYYVTILLKLPKEFASTMQMVLFLLSFAFYLPVNFLAQKFGKKIMLMVAFPLFMLVYVLAFFLGWMPISPELQAWLVVIVLSLPLSIFAILPNAIVADISEADALDTGNRRAAMFFGARTFMQKMGQSIGGLMFPSLLLLGATQEQSWGVRLTALAAFLFLGAGWIIFSRYNETRILNSLKAGGQG